jgi:formate dehydrogenase (coenzyme F420) alpha subunit
LDVNADTEATTILGSCLTCECHCGVRFVVQADRLAHAAGWEGHPDTHGFICPKGRALPLIEHSPDRLTQPLRRRRDGGWDPLTWNDSLDFVAERLLALKVKSGPQSVAVHVGEAGIGKQFTGYAERFCRAFGTPNFSHAGAHCHIAKEMANVLTFGTFPVADYAHSKCLVFWGCNPAKSYPALSRPIAAALRRGARCIVVDPEVTTLARRADLHLQLRPGTDGALALGLLHVVIGEALYDEPFVRDWTVGFEGLRERVLDYSPERVAEITWVPPEKIVAAARLYACSGPACIGQGIALELQSNGVQSVRAISCLQAVCGNLDVAGGAVFHAKPRLSKLRLEDPAPSAPAVGAAEFPVYHWHTGHAQANLHARAVLEGVPYPVWGMIVAAGNPVVSWPGSSAVRAALERLELLVVMDCFMTDTARLAHLVLPAATFLERDELWTSGSLNGTARLGLAHGVLEAPGECHSDWDLWAGLARRLGYAVEFPWADEVSALEWRLAPMDLTVQELSSRPEGCLFAEQSERKYLTRGFRTPTGKVELRSDRLEEFGYDPLPDYVEPVEGPVSRPDLAAEYPLVLTSGARTIAYVHSRFRNIDPLRRLTPEPEVEVHPDTAAALGLTGGRRAAVVSPRGRVEAKVRLSEATDPRVVRLPNGWSEANANLLTDCTVESLDPISGFPSARSFLVRLERID